MAGSSNRVLVVGAGPVGLVTACCLSKAGIPVTIVESSRELPQDLRASTFHPPTLDMLDRFGLSDRLVARGLVCPTWQFRDRREGVIATYNLGVLAGETRHPYRLQCEQWKLSEELRALIEADSQIELVYGAKATDLTQDDDGVTLFLDAADGSQMQLSGRFLVGCDGAHSVIRRALGVSFDGLTIPEVFLAMSTPFKFDAAIADLAPIAYLTDPTEWAVLLRTPSLWRVLLPTAPDQTEEQIKDPATMERRLQALCPNPDRYEIAHATAYRVHQRVAATYAVGRVFLAGDAAHLNNPLGGMGMNGGIHDAINLCDKLAEVWNGAPLAITQRYSRQRRKVAIETVQEQSLRNRKMMAENDPAARAAYHAELRRTVEDPKAHKQFLMRSSMIQSLRDLEAVA